MVPSYTLTDDPEAQIYLSDFPAKATRTGWELHQKGAVVQLIQAVKGGSSFRAVVKEGTIHYPCNLHQDPTFGWEGSCDCLAGENCAHLCAALLTVLDRYFDSNETTPRRKVSGTAMGPSSPVSRSSRKVTPLEPTSPLMDRLLQSRGSKPGRPALTYVRRLQALFRRVSTTNGPLMVNDLTALGYTIQGYAWDPLILWPKAPSSDHELWLFIAWALRDRRLEIPEFMADVTDLSMIEPVMKQWHRDKEVAQWTRSLELTAREKPPQVHQPADLRLVIRAKNASLQWRTPPAESFKDLKPTQSRRLAQEDDVHRVGCSSFLPEAGILWLCCRDPYDEHARTELGYDDAESRGILNQLLRLPGLSERIVTETGQPLVRSTEPLRYSLTPAQTMEENYGLRLVQSDGSPAPEILLALPGNPPLYLTADTLFEGPKPHPFGLLKEISIPAPALETQAGVNLIAELGVSLPPRLAERTRRVLVQVKIYCDLKPTYPGSSREQVCIRVIAEQFDRASERFGADGWRPQSGARPTTSSLPKDGLIPIIDRSSQLQIPRLIESLEAKWVPYQNYWELRLTKTFPDVFIPWLASMPPEIEVLLDPELASLRSASLSGTVRLEIAESEVDWFDLQVVLDVAETELTPDELKLLLNAKGRYVRLGKKGWRRLQFDLSPEEEEQMARIGLDARDFSAEPQRLHALQLTDETAAKLLPPQQVEKIQRRAGELKARVAPKLPAAIRAELRPYQIEGFHFLAYLASNHFGGVLADDMGLGKTLQTLTWLAWLRSQKPADKDRSPQPSLVVCPKSVMDNWETEAGRFLPSLRVRRWQGEDAKELAEARGQFDLIVMNYSQLRALSPEIAAMRWQATILDEAQYIKNPDSQTAQVARALKADHRLALTGTPIENRLLDLWSILAYAMPGVLGNRAQFTRNYSAPDDPLARRRLAARVRPFLLRRTKNQVARDLPDRTEEDLLCELEGLQKTLYRAELKRAQQLLLKVQTKQQLNESRFNILTSLLRLRQICCHPALVDGALAQEESAKVLALVDLLEPLMEEGHKVLVFSQFVGMLEILRDTLKLRDWPHFYLAGDTEDRGKLVNEFQSAKGASVFLISLKAGGFGLNLTAASYVVLFDPWWNPAVESQAIDRTHRIGQTSKVIAYRLLMKGTIEEKIRALQKTKAALAENVLGDETFAKSLTLDDLRFLLSDPGA